MVAEQVQPRLRRRQHLVDRGLACVVLSDAKRPRRLVRHQHVEASHALHRLDFFAHEVTAFVVFAFLDERARRLVVPRRCERPAYTRHPQTVDVYLGTVGNVEKIGAHGGGAAGRKDGVKILVVPLDPVERRGNVLVHAAIVPDVTDAQPERNLGMPQHDAAKRIEIGVEVAYCAEEVVAGTSRSFLSQMKSSLL
jgi:hypothetical protein